MSHLIWIIVLSFCVVLNVETIKDGYSIGWCSLTLCIVAIILNVASLIIKGGL